MKRKSLILSITVIVMLVASVFAVAAQDDGDDTFPFGWMHGNRSQQFGGGWMHGGNGPMMGGGFGFGAGPMWGEDGALPEIAEALGLETDELIQALQDGSTLAEIAEAQGVEIAELQGVMLTHAAERMNEMVEAGVITQEQANEHLTYMSQNLDEMPMFSGDAPCLSGQGLGLGFGPGMMGGGRGAMRGGRGWNNS